MCGEYQCMRSIFTQESPKFFLKWLMYKTVIKKTPPDSPVRPRQKNARTL